MDLKLEYVFALTGQEINNSKLWEFAENGLIDVGSKFSTIDGKRVTWDGKSFTGDNFAKFDKWRYVGVDK